MSVFLPGRAPLLSLLLRVISISLPCVATSLNVHANEKSIHWPTPDGRRPQCVQYPYSYCEGIAYHFQLGSRIYMLPGPYQGNFVKPASPSPLPTRGSYIPQLVFLYPSGSSVPADRWSTGRFLFVPPGEKTVVRVLSWQFLDEKRDNTSLPYLRSPVQGTNSQPDLPDFHGLLLIKHEKSSTYVSKTRTPLDVVMYMPEDGLSIEGENGSIIRNGTLDIADHNTGILARITFETRFASEWREIWETFSKIERDARVK